MDDHTERLIQALARAGLRITKQRLAICRLIANTDEHPTALQIHHKLNREFPSLSLATVYNTLEVLTDLGTINALGSAGDGMVHFDANIDPHVNLACVSCHRVIDLPSQYVQDLEKEVVVNSGYKLLGARVMYYGLCGECQVKPALQHLSAEQP